MWCSDVLALGALVYISGVVLGTILGDARPHTRIGLALLWPLGPLAFVITIAVLMAASAIAFPVMGLMLVGAGLLVWFWSA